ncbi:DNA repair protein RAD4 [Phoenix dactylifera]|uniref:DNA repair protein RAD4 n=1 Tax=Phoenix dactylifera TaxID=42345 RepID=A0A8B7CQ17_PHODC|nr:DNA repair protein RAD4 [Phoenix dactylifera]
MRTRSQSKRKESPPAPRNSEPQTSLAHGSGHGKGEASVKKSKRAASRKASGGKRRQESPSLLEGTEVEVEVPGENSGQVRVKEVLLCDLGLKGCSSQKMEGSTSSRGKDVGGKVHLDVNEMDWEEGTISVSEGREGYSHDLGRVVTVEFTDSPSTAQRRASRRASAEDKVLAELVHKVHLLCLLARGRLVDSVCNDPLIQASLVSLLPSNLLKIVEVPKLTASTLNSLVNWFHNNFHVRNHNIERGSFKSNLSFALETREGTAEEVVALSVALFRALNLTTRFVAVLDVASLKPDADIPGGSSQDAERLDTRIFSSSTVASPYQVNAPYPAVSMDDANKYMADKVCQREKHHKKENSSTCKKNLLKGIGAACNSDDGTSDASASKACSDNLNSCVISCAEKSKRKGDLEFELQLDMALSATLAGIRENVGLDTIDIPSTASSIASPLKKMRKIKSEESPILTHGSSSAVWSRRTGPPLYWAEVYCSGETLTERWVHVDAANGIVDGEEKVEAAVAAFRRPLKYVIAFAGNGAKEVTRRYCKHWYKIASQRISSQWWDTVLAPLKELESGATGGIVQLEAIQEKVPYDPGKKEPPAEQTQISTRNSLEDMELETRALTEPLPTNQLAFKNHHLYALEKWLNKNQVLHPKGPVLGYCSGHPVYPRSCVQTLQTKQRWLREGLQVKPNEIPAKVVKGSKKVINFQTSEPSVLEEDIEEPTLELYGKWQLEPLQLPHAVNGIVPKNERGQVEVWSEKCLPPGTVHLRLPRLIPVAKRLEVDFAPAMVGFEYRNGRCFPMFEGIVVCREFKDAIMEAYAEEEERREAEERKRNERQALSRWFQLLSSIITRQRLKNSYVERVPHDSPTDQKNDNFVSQKYSHEIDLTTIGSQQGSIQQNARAVLPSVQDHEHVFPIECQSFDEESFVRTKRCPCGFSIQVEEL